MALGRRTVSGMRVPPPETATAKTTRRGALRLPEKGAERDALPPRAAAAAKATVLPRYSGSRRHDAVPADDLLIRARKRNPADHRRPPAGQLETAAAPGKCLSRPRQG